MRYLYWVVMVTWMMFFLAVFSVAGHAQILNIERIRLQADTLTPFMFKGTFGLNVYNRSAAETDPVNMFGYNAAINGLYQSPLHAYMLMGRLDYLSINQGVFLSFGFLHARCIFLREKKTNPEVFAQYSYDNFRGLDPRLLAGAGLRQTLIGSKHVNLVLGSGAMFEYEQWEHPFSAENVETRFIKWSNYLSFRASITEYIDFNTVVYFQTGYDRSSRFFRHRISNNTHLNVKITERFSLNNSLDFSYDDRPVVPVTRMVYAFRTGFSLDF